MAKKNQKPLQEQKFVVSRKQVNKDGSVEVINYASPSDENVQQNDNQDSDVTDGGIEQGANFNNAAANLGNVDIFNSPQLVTDSGTTTRNRKRQVFQAKNAAIKAGNIRIGVQDKSNSNYLFIALLLLILLFAVFFIVSDSENKAKIAQLLVPIFGNVINKALGNVTSE